MLFLNLNSNTSVVKKMTKELKRSIFVFLDTELLSNLVAEKKYNEINNSGTQQLSASATKKK